MCFYVTTKECSHKEGGCRDNEQSCYPREVSDRNFGPPPIRHISPRLQHWPERVSSQGLFVAILIYGETRRKASVDSVASVMTAGVSDDVWSLEEIAVLAEPADLLAVEKSETI
jgi:hypothetical protein